VWREGTAFTGGSAKVGTAIAVGTVLMSIYTRRVSSLGSGSDASLAGGRVNWECSAAYTADLRTGDEIQRDSRVYKVLGVVDYQVSIAAALDELR
jgi:hypothetical protein